MPPRSSRRAAVTRDVAYEGGTEQGDRPHRSFTATTARQRRLFDIVIIIIIIDVTIINVSRFCDPY